MISEIFKDLALGLGAIVPSFFKALLDGTVALLCNSTTTGTGEAAVTTITGLSAVGQLGLVFIVLSLVTKFLPIILGFLKMSAINRMSRVRVKKIA